MKNIVLARVDDRLIHGEVVSVWCSPDEITSIKNLRAKGVHVYYQLVPEQQVIEVDGYLNE